MLQTHRRHRIGALAEVASEADRTDAAEDVAAVGDAGAAVPTRVAAHQVALGWRKLCFLFPGKKRQKIYAQDWKRNEMRGLQ